MGTDNLSVTVKKKSRFYSSLSETSHLTTQCTQFSIISKHKKPLLKKLKKETAVDSLNRQLSFEHKLIKELHSKKAQGTESFSANSDQMFNVRYFNCIINYSRAVKVKANSPLFINQA